MRYLVALVLLVGLVGCQEKGATEVVSPNPTSESEMKKAITYLDAKIELVDLRARREQVNNLNLLLEMIGSQLPPDVAARTQVTLRDLDQLERKYQAILEANKPSSL